MTAKSLGSSRSNSLKEHPLSSQSYDGNGFKLELPLPHTIQKSQKQFTLTMCVLLTIVCNLMTNASFMLVRRKDYENK